MLRILIDFDDLAEKFICGCPDVYLHGHSVANQRDPGLIDLRLDLHACRVWQQEYGFLLLNENSRRNHKIVTAAAALLVRVDNLAICGSQDRACLNLRLNLRKLFFFFDKRALVRLQFGSGRFNIAIELNQHFFFRQLI